MSNSELSISPDLVRKLVADQFPQWRELSVREVIPNGWDNRTFRLGEDMSVRMPSAERYVAQVRKEQRWLPILSAELPLPIPSLVATGSPGFGYAWEWSVYWWIEGEPASRGRIGQMEEFARSLAEFLKALQGVSTEGAPEPGAHNFYRGGDLSVYDGEARRAIELLKSDEEFSLDLGEIGQIWSLALDSKWNSPPVWIHGDVSSGNLLVRGGELAGVIDFGGAAVGDPACDLAIAWTMFDARSREVFRDAIQLDERTWQRAKGWTLWKALIILSGLSETNAAEAAHSLRTVERILAD